MFGEKEMEGCIKTLIVILFELARLILEDIRLKLLGLKVGQQGLDKKVRDIPLLDGFCQSQNLRVRLD